MTRDNTQPEALRLAERLETFRWFPDDQAAAAELRRLHAKIALMREALRIAEQYMTIASDWGIDEAEINGEMLSTLDWLGVIRNALDAERGDA